MKYALITGGTSGIGFELARNFARDGCGVIIVSSNSAFQPGPYTSTYFATKAFVLSYSRAIRYEAKKKGVQVCTLCPGATRTNFFNREGTTVPRGAVSAEAAARKAYKRFMKNKEITVTGFDIRWIPQRLRMFAVVKMKN